MEDDFGRISFVSGGSDEHDEGWTSTCSRTEGRKGVRGQKQREGGVNPDLTHVLFLGPLVEPTGGKSYVRTNNSAKKPTPRNFQGESQTLQRCSRRWDFGAGTGFYDNAPTRPTQHTTTCSRVPQRSCRKSLLRTSWKSRLDPTEYFWQFHGRPRRIDYLPGISAGAQR